MQHKTCLICEIMLNYFHPQALSARVRGFMAETAFL